MAKKRKTNVEHSPAPDHLVLELHAPGMSPLHRAGLGGLACTLKYIERAYRDGQLDEDQLPGAPWPEGKPPWEIGPGRVTLYFGKPEGAGEFLKRLFDLAFQIQENAIFLPGQYDLTPPPLPVRSLLQQGLTLTFLQHGRVRSLDKEEIPLSYNPEEKPEATIEISHNKCKSYKHQQGWKDLINDQGQLEQKTLEVIGPLNPGAIVRHQAFGTRTRIEEDVPHVLALYFALVGCLALPINRGCGVLLIPEVNNLEYFVEVRSLMTPTSVGECQITSPGDAALQAQVRLRAKRESQKLTLPGFYTAIFQPTPWASQQKSRVLTMYVPPADEKTLSQFEIALQKLPPRIAVREIKQTKGRGKQKETIEKKEWFWAKSVVLPLVANNLAQGRRWYEGFSRLMVALDPVSKTPIRNRLVFEKEGLNAMTQEIPWQDQGESTLVRAVHEAIRRRYARIAEENKNNPVAMKNRWSGEYDRWRLAFAGAKTVDQFRHALCDLFSRAGLNPVLQKEWEHILPMLSPQRWQLARDLALLALASYTGTGSDELESTEEQQAVA